MKMHKNLVIHSRCLKNSQFASRWSMRRVVVPPCFPTLLAVSCFLSSFCRCPLTVQYFSPSSLSHLLPPLPLYSFLSQLPSCRQCFLQTSCSLSAVAPPEFRFWLVLTLFWTGTLQLDNTNLSFLLSWGGDVFSGNGPADYLGMLSITQTERKPAGFLTGLKISKDAECVNANSALGKMPESA